jgi:hypothetical protein
MFYVVKTKYVCGIDLHSKILSACVMDMAGRIVKKKVLDCQPQQVLDFLAPWGQDITIGVESTYNWYWLVDTLNQYKIPNCLGHALYIKRKMSLKHKADSVDAKGLADLLRTIRQRCGQYGIFSGGGISLYVAGRGPSPIFR